MFLHRIRLLFIEETDSSFTLITVMPQYPGGDKAMFKFLKKNIKYPKEFKNSTIYVSFYIDEEGSVKDEWIILGVSPEVDAEVLRVIKLMPKWTPQYINGKPVRTKYKIPVVLR